MIKLNEIKIGELVKLTAVIEPYSKKLKTYLVTVEKIDSPFILLTQRGPGNRSTTNNILLSSDSYGKEWKLERVNK